MSELKFKINEVSYTGFEEVDIFKTMQSMSGKYKVTLQNSYKGGNTLADIKINDRCVMEIDDQLIMDGYVDSMPIEYAEDKCLLTLTGRDNTSDLIDCSYDFTPNEWKNQTLGNILKNICDNFGISVLVDSSASSEVNTVIDTFKANEGEFVWEIINELCNDNSILAVNYGDGNLTLTKVRNKYTSDGIITGVNVDSCFTEQKTENRYSSIKVKGQGISNDNKALADYISCSGSFNDAIIERQRPLVLFSELPTDNAKCKKKAIWESRIRAGLSRQIIYQVPNWVQTNGKVWNFNELTKVEDDILGIDETKLILSVNFIYSASENIDEVTQLTVIDRNTFNTSENDIRIKSVFDRV